MALSSFDVAVRGHLEELGAALGGEWAFAEVAGAGLRAIATHPALASDLAGPRWAETLAVAETSGIVVRVGSGSAVHPSAGAGGLTPDHPRFLIGEGLRDEGPSQAARPLVAVVARLLGELSSAARRAEEDRLRAERLELRASTDPLTGLLNRRGWDRLISLEEDRCQRHGLSAEIVIVDLDGLKAVNDQRGHDVGDALLVRAATFIFSAVRVHDAAARLGGDEFGVLAVGTEVGAETVGRRIEVSLAEADISASTGACSRDQGGTLAETWRLADLRMYRAKQLRRLARRAVAHPGDIADPPAGGSAESAGGAPHRSQVPSASFGVADVTGDPFARGGAPEFG
jgi:diguanylate cyclase (GGDEF)-like protein